MAQSLVDAQVSLLGQTENLEPYIVPAMYNLPPTTRSEKQKEEKRTVVARLLVQLSVWRAAGRRRPLGAENSAGAAG